MKKQMRARGIIVALSVAVLVWSAGCAANEGERQDDVAQNQDVRQEVEEEFGVLTDDQIAGFEKELAAQYRQLALTYENYDRLRLAAAGEVDENHEEHRTHRRLKRRHETLARLHEDRMWLHAADGGPSSDDQHLSEAHRAAARWHDERFDDDGDGVVEQDSELEVLRNSIHDAQPEGVGVKVRPVDDL